MSSQSIIRMALIAVVWSSPALFAENASTASSSTMEPIQVSQEGTHFVRGNSEERFVVWGVNYDHNEGGELLEDYWTDHWDEIVSDFGEIKDLGCNVVRIHLQLGKTMRSATKTDPENLKQVKRLVKLAEQTGLYLDLTGLGCYHKQDVPDWYDALSETERWEVQARFWTAIAQTCHNSPAIFCYDLMNEPVLTGKEPTQEWLIGELGGKFFVQRITLDLKGRSRQEVIQQWITQLTAAIRKVDPNHMITVGVIPWALSFPKAKPLFHDPTISEPLDFVSVHFYPRKGQVGAALKALKVYDIGKPLLIEEMFPLKCSLEEMDQFIKGSKEFTDGWVSFYWGKTVEENKAAGDIKGAIVAAWLEYFSSQSKEMRQTTE